MIDYTLILKQIGADIKSLQSWARTHDEEHVQEDRRLNILLETIQTHNTNHHGTSSRVKEGGLTAIMFAVLAALGELAGFWDLLSRFGFGF